MNDLPPRTVEIAWGLFARYLVIGGAISLVSWGIARRFWPRRLEMSRFLVFTAILVILFTGCLVVGLPTIAVPHGGRDAIYAAELNGHRLGSYSVLVFWFGSLVSAIYDATRRMLRGTTEPSPGTLPYDPAGRSDVQD